MLAAALASVTPGNSASLGDTPGPLLCAFDPATRGKDAPEATRTVTNRAEAAASARAVFARP